MDQQEVENSTFNRDGFVVVESLIDAATLAELHEAFDRLFRGDFEIGTAPDEVNWQAASGDPTVTRQICNGWKSDRLIAANVLRQDLGRRMAELGGWPGARIIQDNLLWKPPGARSLGFHRDNAYLNWLRPQHMLTCWIALDDVTKAGGTVEFATGSHRWSTANSSVGEFHAPADYARPVRVAAEIEKATLRIDHVEVTKCGGSFHHGWLWHGSGPNSTTHHRRALVLHCASSETRFNRAGFRDGNGPIYSRYAHLNDDVMDENHFPILWRNDGYRTPGI